MAKIKIIVDSASDISLEKVKELSLGFVPLHVRFGDETFKDRLEITSDEFFEKLVKSKELPQTSQPSPEDFINEFKKYQDYQDLIYISITSKASGTYNSACLARDILIEEGFTPKIHILDSLNASAGVLLSIEKASEMLKNGDEIGEILEKTKENIKNASVYFVLDTLEYVRRGGRMGNVKAAIGGLLNIKPLLTFTDGVCTDVGKCRGALAAKKMLVNKFYETAQSFKEIYILFAVHKEGATELSNIIKEKYKDIEIKIVEVGAVMGTYTGPGGLGLAFFEKNSNT